MSAWNCHDALTEFKEWGEKRAKEKLDELRRELLAECPDGEARDGILTFCDALDACIHDEWRPEMAKALREVEPRAA